MARVAHRPDMATMPAELDPAPAARWWHPLADGRIQCDLCPRDCQLHNGQRGACFVRAHHDGKMVLTAYGRSSGFCVDPVEKKPLNHFHPGTGVLSFGTIGCNLACQYCQNSDISKIRKMEGLQDRATPDGIAAAAVRHGARAVAFTYNDPVIFAEYALDTAVACHQRGLAAIAVTAGYIHPEPARQFFSRMDAANVDLKAFSEDFYSKVCAGRLAPVLDTLSYIRHETSCWLEITTLLIPGYNDSDAEILRLSQWCERELGDDVPLHFTAFHPDHRMLELPPTPAASLRRARRIARDAGLRYVYTGNIHDREGDTTFCPGCGQAVIERDWYEILAYRLDPAGCCDRCGTTVAGRFAVFNKAFGAKRIPVRLKQE